MRAAPGRLRAGLAVPTLFALLAVVTFLALGTWQLHRKAWKEALIDTLEQRLSAAPTTLPPPELWAKLDRSQDEFRRVKFSAAFSPSADALVYAGSSGLRSDMSGPGYWAFALARLAPKGLLVINRGFVPEARKNSVPPAADELIGRIDMIGIMRWPEPRSIFAPNDQPERNLWFVRDHLAIAAGKGWGEVAPFLIELESPQPPSGLPRAGAFKPNLRNEHLLYAITWYGLAGVAVVMFVFWIKNRSGLVRTSELCL